MGGEKGEKEWGKRRRRRREKEVLVCYSLPSPSPLTREGYWFVTTSRSVGGLLSDTLIHKLSCKVEERKEGRREGGRGEEE